MCYLAVEVFEQSPGEYPMRYEYNFVYLEIRLKYLLAIV